MGVREIERQEREEGGKGGRAWVREQCQLHRTTSSLHSGDKNLSRADSKCFFTCASSELRDGLCLWNGNNSHTP